MAVETYRESSGIGLVRVGHHCCLARQSSTGSGGGNQVLGAGLARPASKNKKSLPGYRQERNDVDQELERRVEAGSAVLFSKTTECNKKAVDPSDIAPARLSAASFSVGWFRASRLASNPNRETIDLDQSGARFHPGLENSSPSTPPRCRRASIF